MHDPGFVARWAAVEEVACEHGHHGQRQDERAEQREEDGPRHRMKQLPLDPAQREDREVDDCDDRLAEDAGAAYFDRRVLDDGQPFLGRQVVLPGGTRLAEPPDRVLHDDDCAVDDQAEVDGAEAHQVPGRPGPGHQRDREQHCERNGGRHDESGSDVAEQEQKHQNHQRGAFAEVGHDRLDGPTDQIRAVVERFDLDAGR